MGADNQAERVLDRIARLEAAEAEIARLRAQSDSSDRVIQVQHDEIERLRAYANHERSLGAEGPMIELTSAKQEIERLRGENADLRRWKALDKPLTAAMAIANSHTRHDKSLIADLLLERG